MEEAAEVLDESGAAEETAATAPDIDEELLVEEISIDGMCGVY
jgi:mycofactocin precursor